MREPGTQCTLRAYWWDGVPPVDGDFLRTLAGSCYRIDEVHPSRSEHIVHTLRCTRLERNAVQLDDDGVYLWEWARRPRQPRQLTAVVVSDGHDMIPLDGARSLPEAAGRCVAPTPV